MEKTLHIGGKTRTFKLRHGDLLVAQGLMPGGMTVLEALVRARDVGVVAPLAACMLRHEGEGRGKDKKVGPLTVCTWLDAEPSAYSKLEDVVLEVAEAHYVAIGTLDRGDLTGEAPPATKTPSSPDTSPSSPSQDAGGSTQESSEA